MTEKPAVTPASDAPQSRELIVPAFESNIYLGFSTTIGATDITTTAGMATLWTPTKGHKFVLRGFEVLVTCTVACNDGSGTWSHLMLYDNANTAPVAVLGAYGSGAAVTASVAGDIIVGSAWVVNTRVNASPLKLDLGKGFMSRLKNNKLYLGGTDAINAGRFLCSGCVWGIEVPG